MKVLIALASLPVFLMAKEPAGSEKILIDFGNAGEKSLGRITDDGVMGGLSKGEVVKTKDGTAVFRGKLSLENNGGFSSWEIQKGKWDLSAFEGMQLKVKGDGRSYKIRLATTETYRGSPVAFQADFKTVKGEWTIVKVPFSALKPSWRGRSLDNSFDPAKIRTIGIILADKKEGPFALEMSQLVAWEKYSSGS